MRRSRGELDYLADKLGSTVKAEFFIEWAYGAPRLLEEFEDGGTKDVSPRLASGALYEWMYAMLIGIDYMERS